MYEIYALSLFSIVETLLVDVHRVLHFRQRPLQATLSLVQRVDLGNHVVHLVLDLRLPVLDISDALSKLLSDILLRSLRLVVCFPAQPEGVGPQQFGAAPHSVGALVEALIRLQPVVVRVAGVERVPSGGKHWRHLLIKWVSAYRNR